MFKKNPIIILDDPFYRDVTLPLATPRIAQIVYDVLRVDAEPKRSGVTKTLKLDDQLLKV